MHVYICMCVKTCACVHVCVNMCVHVCMFGQCVQLPRCSAGLLTQNAGYFQKTVAIVKRKRWWQNVGGCMHTVCDNTMLTFCFYSILWNNFTILYTVHPMVHSMKQIRNGCATDKCIRMEQFQGLHND